MAGAGVHLPGPGLVLVQLVGVAQLVGAAQLVLLRAALLAHRARAPRRPALEAHGHSAVCKYFKLKAKLKLHQLPSCFHFKVLGYPKIYRH